MDPLPSATPGEPQGSFLLSSPFLSLHPPRSYNLRSQGLTVYSLCPDPKDVRLSDQRAGAGARRINEAPGWGWGGGGGAGRRAEGGLDRWADRRTISGGIDGDFC